MMNTFKITCSRIKKFFFLLLIFFSWQQLASAQTDSIVYESCYHLWELGGDTTFNSQVDTFHLIGGVIVSHANGNQFTTYSYNQLGNLDTIVNYNPRTVPRSWSIVLYNTINKDSIYLIQQYTAGVWTNYSQELYDYDSLGRILSKVSQTWNGSSWQTTKNVFYTYNGNLIDNVLELPVPGVDSTYNLYDYDSLGNYCITVIFYVQSLSSWNSVDGGSSCYNFSDQITSSHYADSYTWYSYDSLGKLISVSGQSAFQGGSIWDQHYDYNCNGLLMSTGYSHNSQQNWSAMNCNYYTGSSDLFIVMNPSQSICFGDTGQIQATLMASSSPVTYLWTPSTGLSSDTVLSPRVSIDSAATYTLIATDSLGSIFTECITINVKPIPDFTLQAFGPTNFCYGSYVDLYADGTGPGVYLFYDWYRDGASYHNSNGNSRYLDGVDETGYYHFVVFNSYSGCAKTSDSIYIFVNNAAQASVHAAGSYCINDTAILVISPSLDPNQNYQWMLDNVDIPGANDSILFATQNGNYTLSVTSDTSSCVYTTANFNVTYSPPPTPDIIPNYDTAACKNTTFKLRTTYNPAWTYTYFINGIEKYWYPSYHDSVNIPINNPVYVKIKASNNGCIVITDSILVDTFPRTPLFIQASTSPPYCIGDTVQLSTNVSNALNYTWSNNSVGPSINVQTTGYFWVRITDINGCMGYAYHYQMFNSAPSPDIIPGHDTTLCNNPVFVLKTTWDTTLTYSYFINDSLYQWLPSDSDSIVINVAQPIYVKIMASNDCYSSFTDSILVNIDTLLHSSFNIQTSLNPPYCTGDTIQLSVSVPYGLNYSWTTGSIDSIIYVATTGNYWINGTDTSGCYLTSDTSSIVINPPPTPDIIPNHDTIVCNNSVFNLSTTYNPAWTYSYFINDSSNQWTSSGDSIAINVSTPVYLKIIASNSCATVSTDSILIDNFPLTSFNIQSSINPPYCAGDSVQLSSSIASNSGYSWSTGSNDSTIYSQITGDYWVSITDSNGCFATSDTSSILFNPLPAIPVINQNVSLLSSNSADVMQWYFNGVPISGATNSTYTATQSGFYSYEVANAFGCSQMSAPYYYSPLGIGISSPIINGIYIYPDLVTTSFTLYCEPGNKIEKLFFEIYNVGGQKVMEQRIEDGANLFERQNLKAGMYFWRVVDANTHEELIGHGKIIFVD